MFTVKNLRVVGHIEAISFLLLLGIAMPLKYWLGWPLGVKVIGMAHGVLFLLYVVVLAITPLRTKLPLWTFPLGFIAAVLPFGPFAFDWLLNRYDSNQQPSGLQQQAETSSTL